MSINHTKLSPKKKEIILEALFSSTKEMKGDNPVEYFINTLLTDSEKITIGRRILIAQMILKGKTQSEISDILGVSPNTYTRTRKWLDGQIPHYNDVLKEHKKEQTQKLAKSKRNKKEYIDPMSLAGLRRKYPAHFLLLNIADVLIKKLTK